MKSYVENEHQNCTTNPQSIHHQQMALVMFHQVLLAMIFLQLNLTVLHNHHPGSVSGFKNLND